MEHQVEKWLHLPIPDSYGHQAARQWEVLGFLMGTDEDGNLGLEAVLAGPSHLLPSPAPTVTARLWEITPAGQSLTSLRGRW